MLHGIAKSQRICNSFVEITYWIFDTSLLSIVLRIALIYVVVLVGLRLNGKREVGQMTPFDFVLLLLIANAVQNAMTGPDTSLTGGWTAAATLFLLNGIISKIVWRSRTARHVIEGTPTVLIHQGKLLERNLTKEQITPDDIHVALREHGILHINEVAPHGLT